MFKLVAAVAAFGLLAGVGMTDPAGAAEQSVPVKKRVVKKKPRTVVVYRYRYRPGPARVVYAAPPVYAPDAYYGYGVPYWGYGYARPYYGYPYAGRPYARPYGGYWAAPAYGFYRPYYRGYWGRPWARYW